MIGGAKAAFLGRAGRPTAATIVRNFAYTGAAQNDVVPAGAVSAVIECWGAEGGGGFGGLGGYAKGTVPVTPDETLQVNVGGQGATNTGVAGWNGGGVSRTGPQSGIPTGSGGGASDVRQDGTAATDRVLVGAGGGGGGSPYTAGGDGGGATGADGGGDPTNIGTGGTQSAGGTTGGALAQGGGSGVDGPQGGGGGFYGGGYALWGAGVGGGGGGSNLVTGTDTTSTQGVRSGHGAVTITYTVLD